MARKEAWIARLAAGLLSLAPIAFAVPCAAEWTDWIAEAEAGYAHDSNISNSSFGSERLDDSIWRPSVRLGRVYQLPGSTRLRALVDVRGELHQRWGGLDSVTGVGQLSLSHKFGLGDAPWGRVFVTGGYAGVQDAVRSGARFDTGAQIGKRFSERLDASLLYRFTLREGDDGLAVVAGADTDVWDQRYHEVVADAHFLLTRALVATAGFEFRHGDLYSNARGKRMLVMGMADVKAVARDRVFGGWSYRMRGESYSPFVSLNYGIGDHWSVEASYWYRYAESDSLDYDNHIAGLTLLYRY